MGRYSRMKGAPDRKLDTTPIEMPLGAIRPTPLQDLIARMVHQAIEIEKGEEVETWEESDDFEEEDPDTLDISQYELQDLQNEASIADYGVEEDPVIEPPLEDTGDRPDPNDEEPDK